MEFLRRVESNSSVRDSGLGWHHVALADGVRNPRVGEVCFIVFSMPQMVKLLPLFVIG